MSVPGPCLVEFSRQQTSEALQPNHFHAFATTNTLIMSRPAATTSSGQFVTMSAFAALPVEDPEESGEELVEEEHAQPSSDT